MTILRSSRTPQKGPQALPRSLPAQDVYEDWTTYPREYYHELYVQATLEYAQLEAEAGNLRVAIQACRRALAQDPYQEEIHRALMMYYHRRSAPGSDPAVSPVSADAGAGVWRAAFTRDRRALYREIIRPRSTVPSVSPPTRTIDPPRTGPYVLPLRTLPTNNSQA